MSAHIVCPNGEYQDSTGKTTCIDCTAGHECSDPTVAPVECLAGTSAAAKSTECTQCQTGKLVVCSCS